MYFVAFSEYMNLKDYWIIIMYIHNTLFQMFYIFQVGYVFPENQWPVWAQTDMWAPEIHFVNNKYHIYYSAKNQITGWHAIGLAISENPLGPYTGKSVLEVLILASTNP